MENKNVHQNKKNEEKPNEPSIFCPLCDETLEVSYVYLGYKNQIKEEYRCVACQVPAKSECHKLH